jgi:hypothetical protein
MFAEVCSRPLLIRNTLEVLANDSSTLYPLVGIYRVEGR